jgi:hypothetical protein
VETHVNYTLVFLIISNFFINVMFITCIYKLRNIKSEFNIRLEILLTFLAWFFVTQLAIGLFIYQQDSNPNFDWLYLILVVRSILTSILTCTRPLWLARNSNQMKDGYIQLPPNIESIENIDMVLHIDIATDYFYRFLES